MKEVESPDNATLVITWSPPVNFNGVILSYSVIIVDISDGSTVRQESVIPTDTLKITETGLGGALCYNNNHVLNLCSFLKLLVCPTV